jgi:SAM-dependent methyltransferase
MDPALQDESARLERMWVRRDAAELGRYLVSDVEDPRINLQSIFSRHFILRQMVGETWDSLMKEECRFSAAMNWLRQVARDSGDPEMLSAILNALERGADNAEGLQVPHFVVGAFRDLSKSGAVQELRPPNYIREVLENTRFEGGKPAVSEQVLSAFCELWRRVVSSVRVRGRLSVLEPACGSANDYRYLQACGIADHIDYFGFDLCDANVANARALFPKARFGKGNIFEIEAPDRDWDLAYVHDLFEHLSLRGVEAAAAELCRVTRLGMCVGFFNMDEIPGHLEQPYEEYHWNRLSVDQMRARFMRHGFACRVRHIGTFLWESVGADSFHNPGAYTFILWRE